MKKIVICMVFVLMSVWVASAQTKSLTGTVVSVERGMYAWAAIVVKVGIKKYFVYTECGDCNTKIVGNVMNVGRKVTFFYTRMERGSGGYDNEVKASRIVEVKKSRKK